MARTCQFLLGTVQHFGGREMMNERTNNVSIPLRYGTTAVFSYYY